MESRGVAARISCCEVGCTLHGMTRPDWEFAPAVSIACVVVAVALGACVRDPRPAHSDVDERVVAAPTIDEASTSEGVQSDRRDVAAPAPAPQRERNRPEVPVTPPATDGLRGVVLDPRGKPVADAGIYDAAYNTRYATSDESGAFVLRDSPSSLAGHSLIARHVRFRPSASVSVLPSIEATNSVPNLLLRDGCEFAVWRDDPWQASFAGIVVSGRDGVKTAPFENGFVRMTGLAPGWNGVRIVVRTDRSWEGYDAALDLSPDSPVEIAFAPPAPDSVRVRLAPSKLETYSSGRECIALPTLPILNWLPTGPWVGESPSRSAFERDAADDWSVSTALEEVFPNDLAQFAEPYGEQPQWIAPHPGSYVFAASNYVLDFRHWAFERFEIPRTREFELAPKLRAR